jgi:rubredoxin
MTQSTPPNDRDGLTAATVHGLLMCPNCGWLYKERPGLVPDHELELPSEKCPGSGQVPRNPESDRRPLWNRLP